MSPYYPQADLICQKRRGENNKTQFTHLFLSFFFLLNNNDALFMILSAVLLSLKQKEESPSTDVQCPIPYILMPFKIEESSSSVNGMRFFCFTQTHS